MCVCVCVYHIHNTTKPIQSDDLIVDARQKRTHIDTQATTEHQATASSRVCVRPRDTTTFVSPCMYTNAATDERERACVRALACVRGDAFVIVVVVAHLVIF